jgi:hypothetical protein
MSYRVDWTQEAEDQLAAIWTQFVPHRQAITQAQDRIDRQLSADPFRNGNHLAEGLYVIHVPPLRAGYEISQADQAVTVVSVSWRP